MSPTDTQVLQISYSLYTPAATVIANTIADMPFSFVRILVYNIIIYFMTGLYRGAGAFFTFELFVCAVIASLALSTDLRLRFTWHTSLCKDSSEASVSCSLASTLHSG